MKYIITESKLHKVILKWMDKEDLKLTNITASPRIYFSKGGDPIMSYDKRNGYVSVSGPKIGDFFDYYFNLTPEQSEEIIKVWLETRYNLEPRFVEFHNS